MKDIMDWLAAIPEPTWRLGVLIGFIVLLIRS